MSAILALAAVATIATWLGIGPLTRSPSTPDDRDRHGAGATQQDSPATGSVTGDGTGTAGANGAGAASSSTAPGQPTVSDCGRVRDGRFEVSACDTDHDVQLIPAQADCSPADVITFAGGDPAVDVLRADLEIVDSSHGCLVRVPDAVLQRSLARVLSDDAAGQVLRECHDRVAGRFVPCSEPHTGEVVYRAEPGSTQESRCEQRAQRYLGTSVTELFRQVRVTTDAGPPRRCVVETRSENYLESPLRHLGSDAVQVGKGF